jgi:hypothetical protein
VQQQQQQLLLVGLQLAVLQARAGVARMMVLLLSRS